MPATTEEFNPPETSRSYSSVHAGDAIGTGHARSMLGSEQAWSARHNDHDEWMIVDLGRPCPADGVIVSRSGSEDQGQ